MRRHFRRFAAPSAGYGLRPNPPYQTAAVTGQIDVRGVASEAA